MISCPKVDEEIPGGKIKGPLARTGWPSLFQL